MRRALLLASLFGCGNGSPDDLPGGPITIGPEGGTVESADGVVELAIPPNAVDEDTVFEITLVTDVPAAVAELGPIGGVYELQPEATVFAVPATLTWTFAGPPTGARDADGNPFMLVAGSFGADQLAFNANTTTELAANTTNTEIERLGMQFLTPRVSATSEPIAAIVADLRGGEHFVTFPWSAREVSSTPSEPTSVTITCDPTTAPPVEPMFDGPDWNQELEILGGLGYSAADEWLAGVSSPLTTMPRWQCTATGTGTVQLVYNAQLPVTGGATIGTTLTFSEPVTCVTRDEKPEYLQERATLTEARVETIAIPITVMKDLDTVQGAFGYFISVSAGQTVEVCVSSTGSAALMYFPRFPPGFDFVDTNPGCTNLTSPDPELPNDVLLGVTGSGTLTVTTRSITSR